MDKQHSLGHALHRAARELAALDPPPAVWAAVCAAHERRHATGDERPRRLAWAAWSGAAACAVLLVGSALLMLLPPADGGAGAAPSGFLPLVPAERWAGAEGGSTWLVSTELPRERLAELGLPYDPGRAGESVRAELLMHASGEVLAVRLLR